MILINLILIAILIFSAIYLFNIELVENFDSNNIIFLDKDDVLEILINDHDKYYNRFFYNDLKVRKIKNIDDYKIIIKKSIIELNDNDKLRLIKLTKEIDDKIKNIKLDYLDGNKINNIKWKIGFFEGKNYESGLPHTRHDIIMINMDQVKYYSDNKLKKTLFHEKIHIYQKKYPDDINIYLKKFKFKRIKKRNRFDNIRANPDLDDYIYADEDNNTYKSTYNMNPNSVEDVTYYPNNTQEFEHPYEKMAINLEKNII